MTLVAISRGYTRPAPTRSRRSQVRYRNSGASRAFTPARILILLALVALAVLMVPRHVTIGGYHLHPGIPPYLVPYLFG